MGEHLAICESNKVLLNTGPRWISGIRFFVNPWVFSFRLENWMLKRTLITLPAIVAIGWWDALCFGPLKAATFG